MVYGQLHFLLLIYDLQLSTDFTGTPIRECVGYLLSLTCGLFEKLNTCKDSKISFKCLINKSQKDYFKE